MNKTGKILAAMALSCVAACGKAAMQGDGAILLDGGNGDDGGPPAATFTMVKKMVFPGCAGQRLLQCHRMSPFGGGLDLTDQNSYKELVGIVASIDKNQIRVVPGDSGSSFLMEKLLNLLPKDGHDGAPMPRVEGGTGEWKKLPRDQLDAVRSWIDDGAKNN